MSFGISGVINRIRPWHQIKKLNCFKPGLLNRIKNAFARSPRTDNTSRANSMANPASSVRLNKTNPVRITAARATSAQTEARSVQSIPRSVSISTGSQTVPTSNRANRPRNTQVAPLPPKPSVEFDVRLPPKFTELNGEVNRILKTLHDTGLFQPKELKILESKAKSFLEQMENYSNVVEKRDGVEHRKKEWEGGLKKIFQAQSEQLSTSLDRHQDFFSDAFLQGQAQIKKYEANLGYFINSAIDIAFPTVERLEDRDLPGDIVDEFNMSVDEKMMRPEDDGSFPVKPWDLLDSWPKQEDFSFKTLFMPVRSALADNLSSVASHASSKSSSITQNCNNLTRSIDRILRV